MPGSVNTVSGIPISLRAQETDIIISSRTEGVEYKWSDTLGGIYQDWIVNIRLIQLGNLSLEVRL